MGLQGGGQQCRVADDGGGRLTRPNPADGHVAGMYAHAYRRPRLPLRRARLPRISQLMPQRQRCEHRALCVIFLFTGYPEHYQNVVTGNMQDGAIIRRDRQLESQPA